MDPDSRFILRKVTCDVIFLACVGFPILFFFLWGKPFERGFFCDDESLRHPFHDSTVTSLMLYLIGLVGPIILISVTEFIVSRLRTNHKKRTFMGFNIPSWVWSSYNVIGVFAFGTACQQLATDIAKYSIGRLRPHFFDVCQPKIDCNDPLNKWRYITEFECTGKNPRLIKEMRLSFPSGHSSFSTYTMIYVAVYVQCRFKWRGSKLWRHGIQFVVLMMAWFTIMSRVSDYKHHWSDVLAGSLIGAVTAALIFNYVSDLWKPRPVVDTPPYMPTDGSVMQHSNSAGNGVTTATV